MRVTGNTIVDVANGVLDTAGKVHGAAVSVMEGVLQFLKLFGIEYFMVSGTLEPNFWNSEISGRLKFHLGSTKFDLRGTFCLGDIAQTVKRVFTKIVDWFKEKFNPMSLFQKSVSIGDMRKKIASYGTGDAAKCAAIGPKWTKMYRNEECSIGRNRDNCIRAECNAMGGFYCGKHDGNAFSGWFKGWCECDKCPDMVKMEKELKKEYAKAQKKLEEEKMKKKDEEYSYEELFQFTMGLQTFDDIMDVSDRYSNKLLVNADALSQKLPATQPLNEVLEVE